MRKKINKLKKYCEKSKLCAIHNSRGITLTTLVITIIVLLILASVATYTGLEAIDNTKRTKFIAELKIMQSYVNKWYEDIKPNENDVSPQKTMDDLWSENMNKKFGLAPVNALNVGENSSEKVAKAQTALSVANVLSANYGRFYLLEEDQKNALGVEGVSQDVLVSVQDRKVVSYLGLKYKEKMYYTIDSIDGENGIDAIYNVGYDSSKNSGAVSFDVSQEYMGNGKAQISISNIQFDGYNNKWKVKYKVGNGNWNNSNDLNFLVTASGHYTINVYNEGFSGLNEIDILTAPECWKATTSSDPNWYSYGGSKVNSPKLVGKMTPIKYDGELTEGMNKTNLWANAETADGSMWVWIPRYAYKITYYTDDTFTTQSANNSKTQYGKISVIFVGTDNKDLETNTTLKVADNQITADPTATGAGTSLYLVHPAFVNNVNNGGWDSDLTGIWIGKFEATGDYDSSNETGTLSVMPATSALDNMTIHQQYTFAQTGTFNEIATLNSHMLKNSEWGAVVYLGYSEYGTNGVDVAKHVDNITTGNSASPSTIYSSNYNQSTTINPYGVYGLKGGVGERTASYISSASGELSGSSTKYKTFYSGYSSTYKGDAIFETSTSSNGSTSWNNDTGNSVYSIFPTSGYPFFTRGGAYDNSYSGLFYFNCFSGNSYSAGGFRVCLCI